MSQQALLYVMAIAVGVSALALVGQALLLLGMYRSTKAIREQLAALTPRAQSFLESAERTLEQSRKQITDVTTKASAVLDVTRTQLGRVDEVFQEASSRARVQMERVELVLDDTISAVHKTVNELNNGILRPIREITSVAVGVRAAFAHLLGGGRPNVSQATSDEEMFI